MHFIDICIFIVYLVAMLGVGFYFYRKNSTEDDYYVGGRDMSAGHVGLSVVATDVGGGFSIGLGGLGFLMGISGSWMLFTGLLGAWLSAVFLIPVVFPLGREKKLLTFPETLKHFFDSNVALAAGVISLIGYIGFTSSQILAGAKLASATFVEIDTQQAVLLMGVIAVVYTVIGGIKAVIYTDTVQWIILMAGLLFIGLPIGYQAIGGYQSIVNVLSTDFVSLGNVSWHQLINWAVTIVPIWFVGMTLYQRIYACKDEQTAKRAWRVAGLFEWPIMAFMGVLLGLFGRVAFEQNLFSELGFPADSNIDAEFGLPLLLRSILPVGLLGLMMSSYFSAIMSTADSCLMAASGNLTTDILPRLKNRINPSAAAHKSQSTTIGQSQILTLVIGIFAVIIALYMKNVLELMLYSYAFMVSGMFVPVLVILTKQKTSPIAALWAMIVGGSTTLILILNPIEFPTTSSLQFMNNLDANIFGILASILTYTIVRFSNKS